MERVLCYGCKEPSDLTFKCLSESEHYFCKECPKNFDQKCRCGDNLLRLKKNVVISKTNSGKSCKYKSRGCTWVFDQNRLLIHSEECRYRPFHCIGKTMNIWNCRWEGSKFQLQDHLKTAHRALINIFKYQEENISYHFDMNKCLYKKIDIVEAFNKTFILHYQFDKIKQSITFMIFLLGTKQDAKKYLYEFEVLSDNVNKKIKIKQPCYNDIGVSDLIQKGKCIILPYQMMQNYTRENNIRIRFRMGKQYN